MRKRNLILTALLCAVLTCHVVLGVTVTLQPVADTSLFENSPDNNLGGEELAAGTIRIGSKSRALIRFDLVGKVPGDATITSVELILRVSKTPPSSVASTFNLHRVLQSWGEGQKVGINVGSLATAGEATWNARSFPGVAWSAPGAAAPSDYAATASGTRSISGSASYTFASAPGLVTDVQAWLANPAANFGWILISQLEDIPFTARRFSSREDSNNGPSLIIQYSAPAQATAPAITAHPQNQTVAAGGTASFSVTATGTAPLNYQWKFNGNDLAGATSPTLTLNNVQLANAGNYSIVVSNSAGSVPSSAATLTVDSLPPPTITITSNIRVIEGSSGSFSVRLSSTSSLAVTVDFATTNGTAIADSDYVSVTSRLTFNPGESMKTIQVLIEGDTSDEPEETFLLKLFNPTNAIIAIGQGEAVITISDDDLPPSISVLNATVFEGNSGRTNAAFVVNLSTASGKIVQLDFATVNGTAIASGDYVATSGSLIFNPGETNKTISISVLADNLPESDESFFVNLTNPANAILDTSQAMGTILTDDTPPLISITKPSDGTVFSAGTDILIQAAATDPDSGDTISKVEFFQGNTKLGEDASISQQIVWTNVPAGVYSLSAKATDNRGATATSSPVTITVTSPSLTISDVTVVEGSGGATNAIFTVTLSSPSTQTVRADYSTVNGTANAGSDYTATSSTLIFNPGEGSKTVVIPVIGDIQHEANETFFVRLSNPTNATIAKVQGQGTIIDDDPPPLISINNVSVSEGDNGTTNLSFSVSLSTVSGKAVSVDYSTINDTATVGSDYAATFGALNFNPGETNKTVFVLIVGDTAVERDEVLFVILSNPVNATIGRGQGGGTILNDDSTVSISTQPNNMTISLGGSATFSVTAAGSGALSYQWKFNGTDISGATNPTLSVDNVQPANAGNYTVAVTNSGGAITSSPASLTVLVPPSITQQPQSQTVIAGTNVTFVVSAAGTEPMSFQWKFNGSDITGATSASLVLTNVQPANGGTYVVSVSNAAGSVTSDGATLTVSSEPETPPRIERIERNGNTINILFTVAPTFELALEHADSLPATTWTTLTNVSAKLAPLAVTVPDSFSVSSNRFYRLKVTGRIR